MESKKLEKPRKNGAFSTRQAVTKPDEETGGVFPTMKPLNDVSGKNDVKSQAAEAPKAEPERIDFSMVKIEPLFADDVDFETFSKSDFRVVKVEACEAVPKSKKLLKFTLNDGTDRNAPLSAVSSRKTGGKNWWPFGPRAEVRSIPRGMLISAVYEYDGQEGLNLLMLDDHIPAGAKLY